MRSSRLARWFGVWRGSAPFPVGQPVRADLRPKVFGVGLPKTGTTTLGVALGRLGYRVREYDEETLLAVSRGDHGAALRRAEAYDAFVDSPWWMLCRELDERFPGSRFILTERRDAEAWYQSGVKHLARTTGGTLDPIAETFVEHFRRRGIGRTQPFEMYRHHGRAVREQFAVREHQFRVLNWERGDGWPELCGFLGLPVPKDVPFPHENAAPPERP